MSRFFAYAIRTVFAAALILVAVAVVGKAFAHSRTTVDEGPSIQAAVELSCAGFDAWFLDPACHSGAHAKKTAHGKHRAAHTALR
jgi:hypothetical protein